MRHQAAERLSGETTEHMQHLAMKGARFDIVLLPSSPTAHGLEQVQFQVAANKGNPPRLLNKVASGGELARISLALQVVASQYTQVPTLIFDEVDTGIGGGVAEMVGKALRALGRTSCCLRRRRHTVWSRFNFKLPPTKAIRPVC